MSHTIKHTIARLGLLALGLTVTVQLALLSGQLDIVRNAAGVGATPGGLSGFVKAADALVTPAVVAIAAACPLAVLAGGAMLMFGNKRGGTTIGFALGALVLVGSVKGIVA